MISTLVKLVASKVRAARNAWWEDAEQSFCLAPSSSVTHSKLMRGAGLPARFHINKNIPSYLLSTESAARRITSESRLLMAGLSVLFLFLSHIAEGGPGEGRGEKLKNSSLIKVDIPLTCSNETRCQCQSKACLPF